MTQKRLRIFAGPNGSGKSTLKDTIKPIVPLGIYINADDIERRVSGDKKINLDTYGITAGTNDLHELFSNSEFVKKKSDADELKANFYINKNILLVRDTGKIPPKYAAAIIAEFIRELNLKAGNNLSFETVMSHSSKIEFLARATKSGYHVYLYYVSIDDIRVNNSRIQSRVKSGGHSVPQRKIKTRYANSLSLLYDALKVSYKSYLFDNSNQFIEVARINRDKRLLLSVAPDELPNWFIKYVINTLTRINTNTR